MSTKQNTPQYTILRLIEKTNRPFYELIDNLCIGRLFVPRVGVEVTFLIPDDKLTAILSKMESNVKTAEECVKIIQACVLMGYYTDPEDFRNGAISVVGGKVAPIPAKNLKIMKDFLPKEYRNSITVWQISDALPSPPVSLSQNETEEKIIKRKQKYDGSDDIYKTLYDTVVKMKDKYDQAYVNLFVAMYEAADDDAKVIIQSHLSYDTFASLYVLLKPNLRDVRDHPYKCLFEIFEKMQQTAKTICSRASQKDEYVKLMASYESKIKRNNASIHDSIAPAIAYNVFAGYYGDIKKNNLQHPRIEHNTPEMMCAEDEFRIISFWSIYNDDKYLSDRQLALYTLDKPQMCTKVMTDKPVYFSIAHALSRSDVLFYEPNNLKQSSKDFKFFQNANFLLSIQKTETLVEYFHANN